MPDVVAIQTKIDGISLKTRRERIGFCLAIGDRLDSTAAPTACNTVGTVKVIIEGRGGGFPGMFDQKTKRPVTALLRDGLQCNVFRQWVMGLGLEIDLYPSASLRFPFID